MAQNKEIRPSVLTICLEYNYRRGITVVRWGRVYSHGKHECLTHRLYILYSIATPANEVFQKYEYRLFMAVSDWITGLIHIQLFICVCTTKYYSVYRPQMLKMALRTSRREDGHRLAPRLTHAFPIPLEYRLVRSTPPCPHPQWPAYRRSARTIVLPSPVRSIKPPGNGMGGGMGQPFPVSAMTPQL